MEFKEIMIPSLFLGFLFGDFTFEFEGSIGEHLHLGVYLLQHVGILTSLFFIKA